MSIWRIRHREILRPTTRWIGSCDVRAHELWGYRKYIEDLSPFATQQSIKGAEFEKVLVIIDDEEGRMTAFSYGKYFGVTDLSPVGPTFNIRARQGLSHRPNQTALLRMLLTCSTGPVRDSLRPRSDNDA